MDEEPSAQAKQSFEQDGYSFVLTDMLRQELPEQQAKEYIRISFLISRQGMYRSS